MAVTQARFLRLSLRKTLTSFCSNFHPQFVRAGTSTSISKFSTTRYYHEGTRAQTIQQDASSELKTTHFGFETVTEAEKTERVATVFTNVAESYDRMNDLMSFGWHRIWKYVHSED